MLGQGNEAECVCAAAVPAGTGALLGRTRLQELLKGDEVEFHSHVRTSEVSEGSEVSDLEGKKILKRERGKKSVSSCSFQLV